MDTRSRLPLAAAILAAIAPLVAALVAFGLFLATFGTRETTTLMKFGGPFGFWAVFASTAAGTALIPVLFLLGRGWKLPAAIPLVLASLPWWPGVLGVWLDSELSLQALSNIPARQRFFVAAGGLGESQGARIFGGWMAAALLGTTALVLALHAASGAESRSRAGRVVALPVLLLFPLLLAVAVPGAGSAAFFWLGLPAVALLGAALLGGPSTGEGQGRTGALAFVALVAGALAWAAGATSGAARSLGAGLEAISHGDPRHTTALLVDAGGALAAMKTAGGYGLLGAALACVLAAVRLVRARPSGFALGNALVALVFAGALAGTDTLVVARFAERLSSPFRPAWEGVADFEAPVISWLENATEPRVVVSREAVLVQGQPFPVAALKGGAEREALVAALKALLPEPEPEGRLPSFEAPEKSPWLEVMIDRRLGLDVLYTVLDLADASGAKGVVFAGVSGGVPTLERPLPAEMAPFFAAAAKAAHGVELPGKALARQLEEPWYTALVEVAEPVEVHDQLGEEVFRVSETLPRGRGPVVLYAGEGVGMERLLSVGALLARAGYSVHLARPSPAAP